MFTEPEIVTSQDLKTRSYITFYYKTKRYREYSGNRLGKPIYPNMSKTIPERNKALQRLRIEFLIALENGTFDERTIKTSTVNTNRNEPTTKQLIIDALEKKMQASLTQKYKLSVSTTANKFLNFLTDEELTGSIDKIRPARIEEFLNLFNTSSTNYMSKRTEILVIFNTIGKLLDRPLTMAKRTERRRIKATLHTPFDQQRLNQILSYLKESHFNLYLCCLITYGTFLRPHKEVRLLTKAHFRKDFTEIHLSGNENKSGRVRVVHVAEYIRAEIIDRLSDLTEDCNIFTLSRFPPNPYYFSTAWKRTLKDAPFKMKENETIYSFRHTAAVHVYKKTKDLHIVQQLIGHSDMIVTLKYLRGLGEVNLEEQIQYMPTL
jgi:integrase